VLPAEARLVVDLKPWARVTITSADSTTQVPTGPQVTPFAIPLPPGRYLIRAENGGLSRSFEREITLSAGQQTTLMEVMPGFDANRIVDALAGQDR
jgi:hypothetical protein